MTWHYRILDHGTHFALHEVYCNEKGEPTSWTEGAITFGCDPEEGSEGIVASLERALADARCRGVLKVPQTPEQ